MSRRGSLRHWDWTSRDRIGASAMEVAIIGTGYVGLATGVALAYLGHSVTCIDTDETKIEQLRRGEVPIYEPWLEELIEIARGNLRFSSRYSDAVPVADVVFITVGTPTMLNGSPDLCYVRAAAQGVGEHLGTGSTV